MEVIIQEGPAQACALAARIIAALLRRKPAAVLGLATGSTPVPCYDELARLHAEEGLSFRDATTFNLDEYVGLSPGHPQSYHAYMHRHLLSRVDLPDGRAHLPDGMADDVPAHCAAYERRIREAGGIDLQLLGIGHDGHIGFNEPTSSLASRTRIKTLTERTRAENARFFDSEAAVPHHVITMGIGTILDSRACLMLAYGAGKAAAIAAMVEGPVTSMCPASALQLHAETKVVIDRAAASQLRLTAYYEWVYRNKPAWQAT